MSSPDRKRPGVGWPAVVLAALVMAAFLFSLDRFLTAGERIARAPAELARGAADSLGRIARGFLTGDVTRRFVSSLPRHEALGAGRLEVAVATTTETIRRSDEQRVLWDLLSLGRTEVEIRVPVTWRWYLPLGDGEEEWRATVDGAVLSVTAPAPRPSLPPAIHTDGIERRAQADLLRFDAPDRLAELESELTPLLASRANDAEHRELAREPARRTVEQFARLWLAREGPEGERIRAVVVRFADEIPADRL